jgi:hypothetical protein
MTKKDAFTSSKTVHPLITLEKCTSTTPVSQVGALVERGRQHDNLVPRIHYRSSVRTTFACKYRWALNSNYCHSCRSGARDATWRVARNWLQVGRLPYYQWKSHWTITTPGNTRFILLHHDSSKHCICPLIKFI